VRIVQNESIARQTVVMDDTFFGNSTFTKCLIVYCGGDFGWQNAHFSADCVIQFEGAARRLFDFMKQFGLVKIPKPGEPLPQASPNTETIH